MGDIPNNYVSILTKSNINRLMIKYLLYGLHPSDFPIQYDHTYICMLDIVRNTHNSYVEILPRDIYTYIEKYMVIIDDSRVELNRDCMNRQSIGLNRQRLMDVYSSVYDRC